MRYCKKFSAFLSLLLAVFYCSPATLAVSSENYWGEFSQNDIIFYDPTGCSDSGNQNCVNITGSSITWVGDSYTDATVSKIEEKFPNIDIYHKGCKWLDEDVDGCSNNYRNPDGMTLTKDNPSGVSIVKYLKSQNKIRDVLVVALGTNGGSSSTRTGIEEILNSVGSNTKVVLTTAYTKNSTYSDFNNVVRQIATEHSNVVVADWASVAKDHLDEYFPGSDHIHPTGGYDAWISVIADAISTISGGSVSLPSETIEYLDNNNIKALAEQNMERYQYAEDKTGVPWQAVAALHFEEANMRSEASIYNGEDLPTDGSCRDNSDGRLLCGDSNEDAKGAAEALISMGKSVYGVDASTDTSKDALAQAFVAYNRGSIYKDGGVSYELSPYAMNMLDSSHMNMTWPSVDPLSGTDGRPGALAVYYYLGGGGCSSSDSGGSSSGSGSSDVSGNLEIIRSAKNADKQYTDFPGAASWSDNDTDSMRALLEAYGDLAYQLQRAIGAPYVAVLTQMRYEDSGSVCGRNNFWGNGCPAGTPPGGASIQGKDLGEGFIQYAQTLTNGYHDQALGETDPKRYLELIGPTWVQGDPNGAGYASIDGMRHSVDALLAYIETPEGQAIVQNFGNYSGTGSDGCKDDCANTMGGVTTKEINGTTYAFPLAGASKSNYLDNSTGRESVLSSQKNGWYHHDYHAVDLGLRASLAGYTEKTPSDYPDLHGFTDMYYYSDGVPVVAFVSGTITSYTTYSNKVPADYVSKCASVSFRGDDGKSYWYGHMAFDDDIKQRVDSGNAHFEVGEKIGEVGPPPCAQSTQSHLHLQTSDKSEFVQNTIAELYEALPEDGNATTVSSSSSNCGSGNASGADLTKEQAEKLAHYYNTKYSPIGCCGLKNCVEVSIFFVSELTTKGTSGRNPTRGNGIDVAKNLVADGYAEGGTEPRTWAIFSTSAFHTSSGNHTGLVIGVNEDGTINTFEAAYSGWGDGYTDGAGNGRIFMNQTPTPDMYFAYFDQYLNTTKLSEILNE